MLSRLAPFAVLCAVVALLCTDRLMDPSYPLNNPLMTGADLTGYFYPAVTYTRSVLARGEIPLWNPYQYAGAPFLAAHQPAVLYPPLLMWLWLPPHLAVAAHALLHVFLAGVLTYGYARSLELRASAALSAGIAYMLSYAVLESVFNTAYLSSYVWLPAVLWGVHEVLRRARPSGVFILGSSVALGILSGHAQAFFYIAQIAGVYALVLVTAHRPRARALALGCIAVVLGVCAAGVQLAMTAELGRMATRTFGGVSLQDAGAGFPLRMMLEGLTGNGQWATIPVLTIPLAIAGLTQRRMRLHALFFALLGLALFDFMRGSMGFVYPVAYHLPFSNLFRIPARAGFAYAFCAAMLIGLGIDAILRAFVGHRRILAIATVLLPLVVAVESYRRGEVPVRYLPLTDSEMLEAPASLVQFTYNRAQYDRLFLERDIPSRVQYNFGEMHEAFVVPYYEPLLPARYRDFFGVPASRLWPGSLTVTGNFGLDTLADPKLLDLLSVRYYVDARASRQETPKQLQPTVQGRLLPEYSPPVLERESALPRAYVVHQVIEAGSAEEAVKVVRALDFDPRAAAVVESNAATVEPQSRGAWEYAHILTYEPQRVELEVRCASRCLAVLTDLDYPGWQADLDGVPAEILRTNYLARGVTVPAGVHHVTYVYRPARFVAGAAVSIAATLALLAVGAHALVGSRSDDESTKG